MAVVGGGEGRMAVIGDHKHNQEQEQEYGSEDNNQGGVDGDDGGSGGQDNGVDEDDNGGGDGLDDMESDNIEGVGTDGKKSIWDEY